MKKTFWGDYIKPTWPRVENALFCKHLIVGGGISGLFTAYFLLENGEKDIVIIEKNTIGSGSTGHSAGMLVCEPEQTTWKEIVEKYGIDQAVKYTKAEKKIIKIIRKIIKDNNISCDFQESPLLLLSNTNESDVTLLSDFITRKKIGLRSTILDKKTINFSGINFGESTEKSVSVNPLLLARGIAQVLEKRGVRIYEYSNVEIDKKNVTVNNKKINYTTITECTGIYTHEKKISKYLTTIVITNKVSSKFSTNIITRKRDMFIDSGKRSYHYGKFTKDGRLLIGYGDVLKKDKPKDYSVHTPHVKNIERFIKKSFPESNIKIIEAWSACYALTKNLLPVVKISKNKFYINGAGTQVDSIVCAQYIADKISLRKNILDSLFKKDF